MSQFQNWIAGVPMSMPPKIDVFPLKANVVAPKGALLLIVSGFAILATTANALDRKVFVCIKAADSTGLADGAIAVSVVGDGQRVTALIGADTLHPGDNCKISGTANAFDLHAQGTDATGLIKATFIGIESEVYSKSGISPYPETFSTNSDPEVNGVSGAIGVFQLGL